MSMFPHTITLYNAEVTSDEYSRDTITNHITVLRGVLFDASKAVNVRESGLTGADAVNLYIPFDVVAIDGADVDKEDPPKKKYVSPIEFINSDDKSGLWTMSAGISKNGELSSTCFFVKGIAVHPDDSAQMIEARYGGDAYNITTIDTKDFGGLPHWEVGGK